jgi:phosphonate metabolism protein PhnN/1,5-bisphosphokinase (PRPP-forming)
VFVVVVGPSGAGKDTLMARAREMLGDDGRFRFVRREITRPAEAGGEEHLAVTPEEFAARRAGGAYALSWEAHGLGYGIPADVAADVAAGRVVIANISRARIADAALMFPTLALEITAPAEVLAARLAARGRETAEDIARRLAREVTLPEGVRVARVMNDRSAGEGAEAVVAVLRGALAEAAKAAG